MNVTPPVKVPVTNLIASNAEVSEAILRDIGELAASARFTLGPAVEAFENAVEDVLGIREAIGVSSGSDAVVCALLASGVGPGHEVITTPFSFFATVEGILRVGARPRFVDIRPDTYELDPGAVESAIGPNTRAILTAHLYGQLGSVEELTQVAARRQLSLIEDSAQAFGATREGRAAGSFGALGCFSFHPTKPLGGWGDSGMVVTNDPALAERCRRLRAHGAYQKHLHGEIGGNYRMDTLQALVLLRKLPRVPTWIAARQAHASAYDEAFSRLSGLSIPARISANQPSYALYTVRVTAGNRDRLAKHLAERGIETQVHYPVPLHRQKALLELGSGDREGSLPEAECAAREVLSLPLYPELSIQQRQHVIGATQSFFERIELSR